jgi:O-antigen/teichoic acid export membrane protein
MMTIVTFGSSISFADLGLSFGLQNRWAEFNQMEDKQLLRKAVSSVFYFLLLISIIFITITFYLHSNFDIENIFPYEKLSKETGRELLDSVFVLLIGISFALPFSIVQKIQLGSQNGYYLYLNNICSSILSLLLLYFFVKLKLGMPFLVFALYGVGSILLVFNFIIEIYVRKREITIKPSIGYFDFNILRILLYDGLIYLGNQISAIILNSSNTLFLSFFHGPKIVAIFNIGTRLTSLLAIPIESYSALFLPAMNDAIVKNDKIWIKQKIKNIFFLTILYGIGIILIFLFFGNIIIEVWISEKDYFSKQILFAFAIFTIFSCFLFIVSNIMLSRKYIKSLIKLYPIAVIITTFLKFIFVPRFQIESVLYLQTLGLSLFFILPSIYLISKDKYI